MTMFWFWSSVVFILINTVLANNKPCAPRLIKGESVVCVCNETYCDDITRQPLQDDECKIYTSSKSGDRFVISSRRLKPCSNITSANCAADLVIDTHQQFQTIVGFGGAVTDAAGVNWKILSQDLQTSLIKSYFSKNGLEYNMIRVPIGGSDFSTHPYAYNESPVDDTKLSNFSLSSEDYLYKIPMIKECLKYATTPVHIIATTWSPPVWMKSNNKFSGFSSLKKKYFDAYANYHIKFIKKYSHENISIWAITTTNEPVNGIIPVAQFNSLGWMPATMGTWITQHLGPLLQNSAYNSTKILAMDDQRYMIPFFFDKMVKDKPSVLKYIYGVAVHYYGDYITPASVLTTFSKMYPDKILLATEACEGSFPWDLPKVILGSWTRAEHYINNIIEDLNHSVCGWMDWNLCLNSEGGPNWAKNFVDSSIIVTGPKEFVKQPMFYAVGHFSKFVPRGSRRVFVEDRIWFSNVNHVAFMTPENTVVVILHNKGSKKRVRLSIDNKELALSMSASSISTIEIKPNNGLPS